MAWADRRHFISLRALVLYVTLWMTWRGFYWAATWVVALPSVDTGHAAVIAAVLVPVTALQKFAFDMYSDIKRIEKEA